MVPCHIDEGKLVLGDVCSFISCLHYSLNFYECPNREHIDCMPIVSKENQIYCEASYRQWIEENCDVYYTD